MWIFLNDSFISIVAHYGLPNSLLVRARRAGDIERAIPAAAGKVQLTPEADYRYRATLPRATVEQALIDAVDAIDYPNFKNSIDPRDTTRSAVYGAVWGEAAALQPEGGRYHLPAFEYEQDDA